MNRRKRTVLSSRAFVVTVLTVILCGCFAKEGMGGDDRLMQLVKKWKTRDGAQTAELSYELSKSLVSDSLFYPVMSLEHEVFSSWLDEIQYGTFTIFEADDDVEVVLYKAYFSKLKELMIQKNLPYLENSRYRDIAIEIQQKLGNIEIKVVD